MEQKVGNRVVDVGQEIHVPLNEVMGYQPVRVLHAQDPLGDPIGRKDYEMDIVGDGQKSLYKLLHKQRANQEGKGGNVPRIGHSDKLLDPIVSRQIGVQVPVPVKIVERVEFDGEGGGQVGVARGDLEKGMDYVDINPILGPFDQTAEVVFKQNHRRHPF
jgi:hypothetical protein